MPYRRPAIALPSGCSLVAGRDRQPTERATAEHHHPEGQLIGSIRGLLSIGAANDVWVMPACQAVWMPPHQPHWVRSHGPFDAWTVYGAESACGPLPSEPRIILFSGLLREAVLRAATWPNGPTSAAAQRVASVILDEIGSAAIEPFRLPLPKDVRVQKVTKALLENPADDRDLTAWASIAAVSERTLSRRFVSETGLSFKAWRQRARLVRALEMLAEGHPVPAIGLALGFATASAFLALFRRVSGTSPAAYRELIRARFESGLHVSI